MRSARAFHVGPSTFSICSLWANALSRSVLSASIASRRADSLIIARNWSATPSANTAPPCGMRGSSVASRFPALSDRANWCGSRIAGRSFLWAFRNSRTKRIPLLGYRRLGGSKMRAAAMIASVTSADCTAPKRPPNPPDAGLLNVGALSLMDSRSECARSMRKMSETNPDSTSFPNSAGEMVTELPHYQVQRPPACASARGSAAPERDLRSFTRGRVLYESRSAATQS
jgi:hypothetical protein